MYATKGSHQIAANARRLLVNPLQRLPKWQRSLSSRNFSEAVLFMGDDFQTRAMATIAFIGITGSVIAGITLQNHDSNVIPHRAAKQTSTFITTTATTQKSQCEAYNSKNNDDDDEFSNLGSGIVDLENSYEVFDLIAALEARDEKEKVRLAQILHDLHELAKEETNHKEDSTTSDSMKTDDKQVQQRRKGLRRYVTIFGRLSFRGERKDHSDRKKILNKEEEKGEDFHPKVGDHISLEGVDLSKLSKQDASRMIDGIESGSKFDVKNLKILLQAATQILQEEPNLLDLREQPKKSLQQPKSSDEEQVVVSVVGDLHGSLDSLTHVLTLLGVFQWLREDTDNVYDENAVPKKQRVVVFDGDFVDRGAKSLEVLLTLLILKLAFPQQVYLIRGNHEDTYVASVYGFQDEIRKEYGEEQTNDLWVSMGKLFGALPIALRTQNALILHGGLPTPDFNLTALETMPKETRLSFATTVKPRTPDEKLLCDILWSDPTNTNAECMMKNPRGLGVLFGSKVARDFLRRNELKYLIRGHEVVAKGVVNMDCGEGTSIITVFSAAAYPGNMGSNYGGILHLLPDGTYKKQAYTLTDTCVSCEKVKMDATQKALDKVRAMISYNRSKLEKAFTGLVEKQGGMVTIEQWVDVMSKTIEFAGMPWLALQPSLAPTSGSLIFQSQPLIDVKKFLNNHSLKIHSNKDVDHDVAETLAQNHEMLLTVFKFLDTNGDGSLSPKEFKQGVDLLNKRLPEDRHLNDPEALFKNLDEDDNGEISFEEFTHGFGIQ